MSILDDISELNERFENLIRDARLNEKTLKKFQAFEIALMHSESPVEFFDALLHQSCTDFGWDNVSVILLDRDYGIRRLLNHGGDDLDQNRHIIFIEEIEQLAAIFPDSSVPLLMAYDPELHDSFFNDEIGAPASVALLPLKHKRQLVGSFNIGSLDESRFTANVATDFLSHLAAVITVCLDNILSREHLKFLGLIDNLTGVNNRRFFEQRLKEEAARILRSGAPMSCLFVDADHFKHINDTYGHPVGDQVLRHIAQVIREQVRTIDIVARYGGEEFTVILLQTGEQKALEVAERIRNRLEHSPFLTDEGENIKLTVSIGIDTLFPEHCNGDIKDIVHGFMSRADQALYTAKNDGRNRTICYSSIPDNHQSENKQHATY